MSEIKETRPKLGFQPWGVFVDGVFKSIQLSTAMRPVRGNWTDWFAALRHNYRLYEAAVERGEASWEPPCDQYIIADWTVLLTPIEAAIWSDIRCYGLPFWPQFPVGRFVVDFADPVRKIALECDGAAYHDADKDARRDALLADMGWRTYRIPGRDCFDEQVVLRNLDGTSFTLESLRGAYQNDQA
jgi:very-short-patch-repair endonuclease